MTFLDVYEKYENFDFDKFIVKLKPTDFYNSLNKEYKSIEDFLTLTAAPITDDMFEQMAIQAQKVSLKQFGKSISLYAPLYLANYCVNNCTYCGFKVKNNIQRSKLAKEDLFKEAMHIKSLGIKHLLILTGESRKDTPVEYIIECLDVIKEHFTSISIEIYSLEADEYCTLIEHGVDGMTMYQETYHRKTYDALHTGPKKDFVYRLETPDRAATANIRTIGIGALLGLHSVYFDSFFTALHASYMMNTYTASEVSVSFPRIRPEVGGFVPHTVVDDTMLVRLVFAFRLFLPRIGITISTRENANFRDNMVSLGITRMSAGSKTEVGGYSLDEKTEGQFDISDDRSVEQISQMIYSKGYQPIYTDWR